MVVEHIVLSGFYSYRCFAADSKSDSLVLDIRNRDLGK